MWGSMLRGRGEDWERRANPLGINAGGFPKPIWRRYINSVLEIFVLQVSKHDVLEAQHFSCYVYTGLGKVCSLRSSPST